MKHVCLCFNRKRHEKLTTILEEYENETTEDGTTAPRSTSGQISKDESRGDDYCSNTQVFRNTHTFPDKLEKKLRRKLRNDKAHLAQTNPRMDAQYAKIVVKNREQVLEAKQPVVQPTLSTDWRIAAARRHSEGRIELDQLQLLFPDFFPHGVAMEGNAAYERTTVKRTDAFNDGDPIVQSWLKLFG